MSKTRINCMTAISFLAAACLMFAPSVSSSAGLLSGEAGEADWYEGNNDEQNAFLYEYFTPYMKGASYDPNKLYSSSNTLYLEWLKADKDGRLASAPDVARERAAATFLRLKRNEIFARNGDRFSDPALQTFFASTGWYREVSSFSTDNLTEAELANIQEIKDLEKKHKGDAEAAFYTHTPIQVKLSDGSALKGNIRLRYFLFDSDYGRIRVPVGDITEIRPGSGDNGFKVYLKNGDAITSSSANAKIPVLTLFGEVNLEISSASQITFVQ